MEESITERERKTAEAHGSERTAEAGGKEAECERLIRKESLLQDILKTFPGRKQDIRTYSPLTLAYIGDAVFDLIIRTIVVEQANRPANQLHHAAIKYVSAPAQARMAQVLLPGMTEQEQAVYRRGKNAKPHTTARNASHEDYMKATGFESVLGYLYLTDHMDRVLELVKAGIELTEPK